jgi:predicted GIY-YIG superfamily endonuclease
MYYYYIIKVKSNLIKVGITKNLTQRIKAYRTSDPLLSYHKTYDLDISKKETLFLEKQILNELKRWYQCRSETIESDNTRAIEMVVEGIMEEILGKYN